MNDEREQRKLQMEAALLEQETAAQLEKKTAVAEVAADLDRSKVEFRNGLKEALEHAHVAQKETIDEQVKHKQTQVSVSKTHLRLTCTFQLCYAILCCTMLQNSNYRRATARVARAGELQTGEREAKGGARAGSGRKSEGARGGLSDRPSWSVLGSLFFLFLLLVSRVFLKRVKSWSRT